MMHLRKPQRWALQRGFLTPQAQRWFDHADVLVTAWDKGRLRDHISGAFATPTQGTSGSGNGAPIWSSGKAGYGRRNRGQTGTNAYVGWADVFSGITAAGNPGTGDFVAFAAFQMFGANATINTVLSKMSNATGTDTGWAIFVNTWNTNDRKLQAAGGLNSSIAIASAAAAIQTGRLHRVVLKRRTVGGISTWALFLDGKLVGTDTEAGNITNGTPFIVGGWSHYGGVVYSGNVLVHLAGYLTLSMSDAEARVFSNRMFDLIRPADELDAGVVYAKAAASGGVSLVVAGGSHGHAADNLGLTQAHALAVANAGHGHAADNLVLTQAHVLALQEALHDHAADSLTLTQDHVLVLAEANHGHTADSVVLTQDHVLVLADALHAHAADNLELQAGVSLLVADAGHVHAADNLDLTQDHYLAVADAAHAQTADNVVLAPGEVSLAISDAWHAQLADHITLGGLAEAWPLLRGAFPGVGSALGLKHPG